MSLKRLNKAIAESGYCSRREADKLIEQGKVSVNGKPAELGLKVTGSDQITINGKSINKTVKKVYLQFNKPRGIECTTDTSVKNNIISYLNYPERIFPVGRLDKASEGLIFLTNDGDIVNKILRSRNGHEKEYIVTVNKPITNAFLKQMRNGVPILDTVTQKCEVEKINSRTFKIILTQGLNRQIRRMCEHLGYEVKKLVRVRIMNIRLQNLKKGTYRHFTKDELHELNLLLKDSSKTYE